mmetsp:Transcript_7166/g.21103  ORF Transcript_7166/g.21103 Transcript_7166/m.21103 type:complete len:82 (+) Transcript_7166:144-389(+)
MGCGGSKDPAAAEPEGPSEFQKADHDKPKGSRDDEYYNVVTGETTTIHHEERDKVAPLRGASSGAERRGKMKRAWSSFIGL